MNTQIPLKYRFCTDGCTNARRGCGYLFVLPNRFENGDVTHMKLWYRCPKCGQQWFTSYSKEFAAAHLRRQVRHTALRQLLRDAPLQASPRLAQAEAGGRAQNAKGV